MEENKLPDFDIVKDDFQTIVETFHNNCLKDNGRYRSWEHCKNFFDKFASEFYQNKQNINNREDQDLNNIYKIKEKITEEQLDLACLHLAFYLASWGMYRGSSFLLQYDYTKHKDAILTLLQKKYQPLWITNKTSENKFFENKKSNIELLFGNKDKNKVGLIEELSGCYNKKDKDNENNEPTHTLITKILMGTMGCIPAFDRYLISGLKIEYNNARKCATLDKNNYEKFFALCEDVNNIYTYYGKPYPKMKLLDMYFWELGYEKDILDWLNGEGEYKTKFSSATKMLENEKTEKKAKFKINKYSKYFESRNEILEVIVEFKKQHNLS